MTLLEIFNDLEKGSTKWSGYFDVYERHLNKYRGNSPRILEIGILGGGSIDLWHEYFGEGTQITAIDIDENCKNYSYNFPVEIVIGDQGDPAFWDEFFQNREPYDIVIDDGGHRMNQQIITLQKCFPHIKDNGVFITEDVHTSYWNQWDGLFRRPHTFLEYSKRVVDHLNMQHFNKTLLDLSEIEMFKDLYSVFFYNSQVVFEKKMNQYFMIVDNKQ